MLDTSYVNLFIKNIRLIPYFETLVVNFFYNNICIIGAYKMHEENELDLTDLTDRVAKHGFI